MPSPRTRTALSVAVLIATLSVSGCGGGSSTSTAELKAPAADAELTGKLTVLHYYDEGSGGLQPFIKTWEQRFEKAHPKVDIKFEYVPYDQMQQKVISAAAAGKGWDVIMPSSVWIPEMAKSGAVQPIGPLWDASQARQQFPPKGQEGGVYNGKRYTVQAFTNIEGIFYNKKILDDIGAPVPTTLDDMEAAMAKAKAKGYNAFTTAAPTGAGGEFNLVPWLVSAGWSYQDPGNATALKVLDRLQTWRDKGWFSANDASGFVAEKNFTTGKYAFAQGGNWNLGSFKTDLKFPWGAAAIPGADRALLGGEVFAIGGKAANPGLAWRFIEDTFLSEQGAFDAAAAGSVPLRSDVQSDKRITGDPNLAAFAKIASGSIGNPMLSTTGKISDALGGAWNEFVSGKIDATEAAKRITTTVPPLMKTS